MILNCLRNHMLESPRNYPSTRQSCTQKCYVLKMFEYILYSKCFVLKNVLKMFCAQKCTQNVLVHSVLKMFCTQKCYDSKMLLLRDSFVLDHDAPPGPSPAGDLQSKKIY